MALAAAAHHSAARAGVRLGVLDDPGPRRETEPETETYAAPRGPKPPSPREPSLAVPLLAGAAGEAVDGTALAYLLQQSPVVKKEEAGGAGGPGAR